MLRYSWPDQPLKSRHRTNQTGKEDALADSHGPAVITPDGKLLYMVSAIGGDTVNEVVMVDIASGKVVGKPIGLTFPTG